MAATKCTRTDDVTEGIRMSPPPATASYRLLPEITLTQPVTGEKARRLAKCFSKGVVRVVEGEGGEEGRAEVVNPRSDTCSREVLRHKASFKQPLAQLFSMSYLLYVCI